ncbi:Vps62-related protein, partial [Candidatus Bathyarchaeota archaeon]|nr:Vps62-related protein [Candidatus Bathyarchaeota archaeon]
MRKCFGLLLLVLVSGLLLSSPISSVSAQSDSDNDGISDLIEEELALKFEPVLIFAEGENFFPTDAGYHIDNSELFLKSEEINTLIDSSPTASNINQYTTEDYFLNNTLGGFKEIAKDYKNNRKNYGDKIYAHITSEAQNIAIQYWFFYAFNPGSLNQHQGDWEMIEIILDLNETPLYAVYSQHHSGEMAEWNDVEIVDDTHPIVYVALGSHANYFRYYQGRLGTESDTVGNAYTLYPEDLEIALLGEKGIGNQPDLQEWLDYGGRWGNWAQIIDAYTGSAGPSGPGHGENLEKWTSPVTWGMNSFLVDQTWFTASLFVYYFIYIFVAIIGILAIIKIWKIIKLKKSGNLNLIRILKTKSAIGVILGIVGILVYFAALFLPWYAVMGNIQTTMLETTGTTELVLIDGVNGVRINTLQNNQGLTTMFGIGIPFSIVFL